MGIKLRTLLNIYKRLNLSMEKKQRKQLILMAILLVTLAVVWYGVIFGVPFSGPEPVEEERVEEPDPDAGERFELPDDEVILEMKERAENFLATHDYDAKVEMAEGRDIFSPPIREPEEPEDEEVKRPELNLTAILWSQEKARAMINDQIVAEGDAVLENVEVKDIRRASVTLDWHRDDITETIYLPLEP